jgi:hypothetical protein
MQKIIIDKQEEKKDVAVVEKGIWVGGEEGNNLLNFVFILAV